MLASGQAGALRSGLNQLRPPVPILVLSPSPSPSKSSQHRATLAACATAIGLSVAGLQEQRHRQVRLRAAPAVTQDQQLQRITITTSAAPEARQDGVLRRYLVALADNPQAFSAAMRNGITPGAVAEALIELGVVSAEPLWVGSREALENCVCRDLPASAAEESDKPSLEEAAARLLDPSLGDRAAEANALFWRLLTFDVLGTGTAISQAASKVGLQFLGSSDLLKIEELPLEDEDWAKAVREAPPQQLGRVLVAHTCHTEAEVQRFRESTQSEPHVLTLEVGAGFGFGDHPTTKLASSWLQSLDLQGRSILDYGCGTGVLGMMSLLLGAKEATGVDCDLVALRLARANAARNRLKLELFAAETAERTEWACVAFYHPSESTMGRRLFEFGPPKEKRFDVVVANMTPGPLVRLAPTLAAALAPGGMLGVSGLQEHAADQVIAAFANEGVKLKRTNSLDSWLLLSGGHV